MTPQAQPAPELAASAHAPRLREVQRHMDADRLRILLIEDNASDAELLAEALSSRTDDAFEIMHVERLDQAARAARDRSFEIALLDLGLAETHGLDTLVAARAQIPHVPIIVLTGMDDDDLGLRALQGLDEAGAEARRIIRVRIAANQDVVLFAIAPDGQVDGRALDARRIVQQPHARVSSTPKSSSSTLSRSLAAAGCSVVTWKDVIDSSVSGTVRGQAITATASRITCTSLASSPRAQPMPMRPVSAAP